jgi:HlyD family secretion protein
MESQMTSALHSIQRYMIIGMVIVGLVTFGIGGWAATSELTGAVIGQGVLVVDSSVKKVQHPTGGVVGELRVREGDKVVSGDILLRLDETQTLANATIVSKSFDELLARQARLEAERDNADEIIFPKVLLERTRDSASEAGRAIAAERSLFDLRRQARGGQKAQLKERSAQLQEEIKGYLGQAEAKQKEIDFIHKELEGVCTLRSETIHSQGPAPEPPARSGSKTPLVL